LFSYVVFSFLFWIQMSAWRFLRRATSCPPLSFAHAKCFACSLCETPCIDKNRDLEDKKRLVLNLPMPGKYNFLRETVERGVHAASTSPATRTVKRAEARAPQTGTVG
jgi:hypothetical protein